MDEPHPSRPDPGPSRLTRGIVVAAAALVVVGALRLTAPVSMPLTFAFFVIAVAWPLTRALQRQLPAVVAALVTLAVVIAIGASLLWALGLATEQMAYAAIAYEDRWIALQQSVRAWLQANNLPAPTTASLPIDALVAQIQATVNRLSSAITGLVLILAFMGLGLAEIRDLQRKVTTFEPRLVSIVRRVATDLQRYMVIRTFIGLLTGALVGLGTWMLGLQLAFLWATLTFILNYIPTLGSILAILPPVLFAWLQLGGWGSAVLTLAVVGGVQLVVGNGIDPMVQGRTLRLSPLVVLISVTFWGWVWGVAGAFLGVPITIGIMRLSSEFEGTRWLSVLLAPAGESPVEEPGPTPPALPA